MADALTRFVSLVLIEKNCFYESKKRKVIFNIRLWTNDESDAALRLLILIFFIFFNQRIIFFVIMPCLLLFKFRWSSWGRGWGSSLRLGFPAVEQPLPWPSEKKIPEEGLPLFLSRDLDFKKQLFNSNWRRRQRQWDCQTRQFKTKLVLWIA